MLPIPTSRAAAAFAGCLLAIGVGVFTRSPAAVVLGGGGLVGLAVALAAAFPLGRRLRRERLEFAWWIAPGAGGRKTIAAGMRFEIRCHVRHRGEKELFAVEPVPITSEGVFSDKEDGVALCFEPQARTEFEVHLVARAPGRAVLHGLALTLRAPLGLFEIPLYFPNPLSLRVWPRAAPARAGRRGGRGGHPEPRSRASHRQRGGGTELYELRELQPGDPFNSIAWKASARRGRLLTKEVEREVQRTTWMVLDASATMRGGTAGRRKIDFAIEAAAAESRAALARGDRVGLVTFDHRALDRLPPSEVPGQMFRIHDALLEATQVVDEERTAIDEPALTARVGLYVRHQDGLNFARRDPRRRRRIRQWDIAGLIAHISRSLEGTSTRNGESVSDLLRRFCQARAIPLPFRPLTPKARAEGFLDAVRHTTRTDPAHGHVMIFSDLDGIEHDSLISALRFARSHGHSIEIVLPGDPSLQPAPRARLEGSLETIYGRSEHHRVAALRTILTRLGVGLRMNPGPSRSGIPKSGSQQAPQNRAA